MCKKTLQGKKPARQLEEIVIHVRDNLEICFGNILKKKRKNNQQNAQNYIFANKLKSIRIHNKFPGCGKMLFFHLIFWLVNPLWSNNTTPLTEQGTQHQQNTLKVTLFE